MAPSITHTPVYCTDLDEALAFYTQRLCFEVHDDVPMGPDMRWLTLRGPGDYHDLLLAAVELAIDHPRTGQRMVFSIPEKDDRVIAAFNAIGPPSKSG